jgi:hypothetical protein
MYYFKKAFILFFIFYMGGSSGVSSGDKHNHRNISLFNRNICRDGAATNNIVAAYKRRLVYYVGSHRVARLNRNSYVVVAKDVLRKYIYIVNIVVIYIILYAL